jgi:hypothetical protein
MKIQNYAARKIQDSWRFYRLRYLEDLIKNSVKHKHSTIIQKYLKGLNVSKHYESFYVKLRIDGNYDFFR